MMNYHGYIVPSSQDLEHHGVLGMKWGVRRYQNKDGSLTSAGRKRYGSGEKMDSNDKNDSATTRRVKKDYNDLSDEDFWKKYQTTKETYRKRVNRYGDPYMNAPLAKLGKSLKKRNKDKRGRQILTKNDVNEVIRGLELQKQKLYSQSSREIDKQAKIFNQNVYEGREYYEKFGKKLGDTSNDDEMEVLRRLNRF